MTDYRLLADALESAANQRGKLGKLEVLARALSALSGEELRRGARLLSGSAFAEWEQIVTSVGWVTVARAACAVTGWDRETLSACAAAIGDLGEAVSLLMPQRPQAGPSIEEVDALFRRLATLRQASGKHAAIETMLHQSSPVEAKYLLKTLAGGLRIGADITTVEEAVARAFGADRAEVSRARRDSGDIGETAVAAREGRLSDRKSVV